MFADHETSERRMSWRTERRINIFFMVRNTANIYREKGIVACNSERWSRLHLFPPSVFYSARSSESARSVRVFRSVSQQNSKDTTSRLRIAIITRASISDLGCKRHYTRGPIMHAIDSGHFVIFIPRSPTDARSLLSPDGRLCSVMIYSIFFFLSLNFFLFLHVPFSPMPRSLGRSIPLVYLSAKRFLACVQISRAIAVQPDAFSRALASPIRRSPRLIPPIIKLSRLQSSCLPTLQDHAAVLDAAITETFRSNCYYGVYVTTCTSTCEVASINGALKKQH